MLRQQHEAERAALEEERKRQRRETEAVQADARAQVERDRAAARRVVVATDERLRQAESTIATLKTQAGGLERALAEVTEGREDHIRRALEVTAGRIVQAEKGAQADREAQALAQAKLELAERRMEEQRAEHVAQLKAVDDRWARSLAALQKAHQELSAENRLLRQQLAQRGRKGRQGGDVGE